MSTITLIPESKRVFNEFDHQGILLGLERLKTEKNPEYKRRLLDIFVNRASSTYRGLINGITRELGLEIKNTIQVNAVLNSNNEPLATNPAVVFEGTKCILYSDFSTNTVLIELDRFESNGGNFTINELVDSINATSEYSCTLLNGIDGTKRSMTIFNQKSVELVPSEDISNGGLKVRLDHSNLVPGTVSLSSPNLLSRRSTLDNLKDFEYYIDLEAGTIFSSQVPAPGSIVRYQYRNDNMIFQSSPVIIHNLQSDDFKSKMFEQVCTDLQNECRGLPTELGADIINELLSVFPTNYGT